ncbi:MAG: VOC family protein [Myxococcales bacterium]|nr:VOC family protein [Myxococcales bacterium]
MIEPGTASVCLRAPDLDRAKDFYAQLGFRVVEEVPGQRVVLQHGSFHLALMSFLESPLINFRGGDAFAIQAHMKQAFPDLEGEAEHYTPEEYDATADGACWATRDPAGNEILFDTYAGEQGPAYVRRRTGEILAAALSELEALGADTPFMDTLRSEVRTQTETR